MQRKDGVGMTSLLLPGGMRLAQLDYRTLVMSIDPAHSVADAFDLDTEVGFPPIPQRLGTPTKRGFPHSPCDGGCGYYKGHHIVI